MRTEIRMAGFGGQGIITMGRILGRAAVLYQDLEAILSEDYGPEKTGGWSKGDLVLSDEEIGYPLVDHPDIFVALSQDGFERYCHTLRAHGRALCEAGLVHPGDDWDHATFFIPAVRTANELGKKVVANIVMIGALVELTGVLSPEATVKAIRDSVPKAAEELNKTAFERGRELAKEAMR